MMEERVRHLMAQALYVKIKMHDTLQPLLFSSSIELFQCCVMPSF